MEKRGRGRPRKIVEEDEYVVRRGPGRPRKTEVKRGRGRPKFAATPAMRKKVTEYKAGGMRHEDIANVLKISRNTLEKYFETELKIGPALRLGEVIELLFASARKGNVAAQRELKTMLITNTAAEAVETLVSGAKVAAAPKQERLGKKAEEQKAAEDVGGIYAVPPQPKLVVNNKK